MSAMVHASSAILRQWSRIPPDGSSLFWSWLPDDGASSRDHSLLMADDA
jgi:hypothetical protein